MNGARKMKLRSLSSLFIIFLSVATLGSDSIDLPNGKYSGSTRKLEITNNLFKLEVSATEKIEITFIQGIGPVQPGNSIYMDDKSVPGTTAVGKCQQTDKKVCFFMITQPRISGNGVKMAGQKIKYRIQITDESSFLTVDETKIQEVDGQNPVPLEHWNENFYLDSLNSPPAGSKKSEH